MKTIIEYKIAFADITPNMAKTPDTVEDLLCDCFQPYGSPVVVVIQGCDYVMQAMVLYGDG